MKMVSLQNIHGFDILKSSLSRKDHCRRSRPQSDMKRPAAAEAARGRKVLKRQAGGASGDSALLVLHNSTSPREKIPSLADLQRRTKKLIAELHPSGPLNPPHVPAPGAQVLP
jgi:hypothetical protein